MITDNLAGKPFRIAGQKKGSWIAWIGSSLLAILTFFCFLLLDPDPNILLASCSAINVFIILWSIYQLYIRNYLLSPLAPAFIGYGNVLYYSIGNLGARIQGNERHLANPGALEYYPEIALLSTIGLVIFTTTVFLLYFREKPIVNYKDLFWKPYQGIILSIVSLIIIFLLQFDYRDFYAILANWFLFAFRYIVILSIVVNSSLAAKSRNITGNIFFILLVFMNVLLFLGDRSRINLFIAAIIAVLCLLTLRPKWLVQILIVFAITFPLLFSLGTALKFRTHGIGGDKVIVNLSELSELTVKTFIDSNVNSVSVDAGYRTAGFELPATIMMNFDLGLHPLYGKAFKGALYQGLPDFLRPPGMYSDRIEIIKYFGYQGFLYDDETIGIPLAIGLADFGIIGGIVIYLIMAILYWLIYKVTQISPNFFIAYLMIATTTFSIDLFWVSFFVSIKAMVFSVIFLTLTPIISRPQWIIKKNDSE